MSQKLMIGLPRLLWSFSVSSCLIFLLASCTENKLSQCQRIFQVANGVKQETQEMTKSGKVIDKKTWFLAANKLEEAAKNMESMTLSDKQLKEYQTGFAEVYRDYAGATREIIKVLDTKDRVAAKSAQEKVKRASKLEQELGTKINSYCQ
jgi:predicted metal-dependent hydrolase